MRNIDSDLIRGNIDTIILKTMLDGDKYGLDIIKEVEARSNGTYELKQPTLYSCLKRLENQELISSYWLDSDIGGKRHYYKLTEKGREFFEKKQEEWAKSKFIIDNLLSGYNYDEYMLVKKDDYNKIQENRQFEYSEPNTTPQITQSATNEDSFENSYLENEQLVKQSDKSDNDSYDDYNDSSSTEYEKASDTNYEDEDIQNDVDEDIDDDDSETIINNTQEKKDYPEFPSYDDDFDVEQISIADTTNNQDENTSEDSHSPVYVNNSEDYNPTFNENNNLEKDEEDNENHTASELNILERLRSQDDEEINIYYGDKNSYINHLNMQESESPEINDKINEFSSAINDLNNFSIEKTQNEDLDENLEHSNFENILEDSTDESAHEDLEEISILNQEHDSIENDDFLNELEEVNRLSNSTFYNSSDKSDYQESKPVQNVTSNFNYDYSESDSSDAAFEDSNSSYDNSSNETYTNTFEESSANSTTDFFNEDVYPTITHTDESFSSISSFDDIISQNSEKYTAQNSIVEDSAQNFTPKYISENYKEKLSNLSAYSKIEDDSNDNFPTVHTSGDKVKDIETLKTEFESEGIKVKEFKKYNSKEELDKDYLLINKINLIRSLILLFGYIFVLSGVYIVLNNTPFRNTEGFSINWFLIGFIPFVIFAIYNLILFAINPYKKIPARYAPRIMILISLIIVVQLLLITYCVNLQLGFYSFSQAHYNHLAWLIPTIISFAPIISNIIYIALFYSKNFNV